MVVLLAVSSGACGGGGGGGGGDGGRDARDAGEDDTSRGDTQGEALMDTAHAMDAMDATDATDATDVPAEAPASDASDASGASVDAGDAASSSDGGAADLPPPLPGAWVCPASDGGTPFDPAGACTASGLLDFSKVPVLRARAPQSLYVVTGVDLNDRGDVLLGMDGGGNYASLWLATPRCRIELPYMNSGQLNYQVSSVTYHVAINNRASVAATADTPRGAAALFCNGTCRGLSYPPSIIGDTHNSFAAAINERDVVVGIQNGPQNVPPQARRAHQWATDLGQPGVDIPYPDVRDGTANAINDAGQVVGAAGTASGIRAFLWSAGAFTDLGTLGGTSSNAIAINAAGQVAGISKTATGVTHAFLWQAGVMRDLGTLGGRDSSAVAINASGQVAGSSHTASGQIHAFLWSAGVMRDLGTLGGATSAPGPASRAVGTTWATQLYGVSDDSIVFPHPRMRVLNDAGQVVGTSTTTGGAQHAFLWSAGAMRDLGTLDGANFSEGVAINAAGRVLGNGVATIAGGTPSTAPTGFLFDPSGCPTGGL